MSQKIPVAVLAATGSVGQRFVQLLDNHPWFEVTALTGSERSVGRTYGETCHWLLPEPMPAWARDVVVSPTDPAQVPVKIAFSALPADAAKDVEPAFAKAGIHICSNASAYRRAEDVAILLPEVNPEHASIIKHQQANHGWKGSISTNPNCTSTGLTVALKALKDAFGLSRVFAVSLQALSGAGYPGVASMDIIDNVIPFISGEEEKVEWETRKMLGDFVDNQIRLADYQISAHTNRVAVTDGHIVCASIELKTPASPQQAAEALASFQAPEITRGLPSCPNPVIVLKAEDNRPQPRLDRMTGKGMATVVGRVRADSQYHLKLVVLSHNTIRGAAGGSIFNAELLQQMGLIG